GLPGYFGVN
nr:RecName: Full=Dextransucrase; AltName: Full=Glucansucrase; AltName: Full=Sucrose 6-glucosyltransferase [Leuconostoc mesenteroides]